MPFEEKKKLFVFHIYHIYVVEATTSCFDLFCCLLETKWIHAHVAHVRVLQCSSTYLIFFCSVRRHIPFFAHIVGTAPLSFGLHTKWLTQQTNFFLKKEW